MKCYSVPSTSYDLYICKKVSEYDQEIPQSQTADKPMAPQRRATHQSRGFEGAMSKG